MKFIVDAQLPLKLKLWLRNQGFNCIHAIDLPNKEFTTDKEIVEFSLKEKRIVITKDGDFYKYFLLTGKPKQILFVTTGNIVNRDLLRLFELNFESVIAHFDSGKNIIELSEEYIKVLK